MLRTSEMGLSNLFFLVRLHAQRLLRACGYDTETR